MSGIESGTTVIAVTSGKGGVGKSTVSLNLALALAASGLDVGVLDADFYGPDIPLMVNLKREARRERWMLWRSPDSGKIELEPVERFGLKLMSIGFLIGEGQALALPAGLLRSALLQLFIDVQWGPLDYLIVDMPPGTADLQQELFGAVSLTGALVVVGPQDVAHLDGRKILDLLRDSNVEIIGGIENMTGLVCPDCGETVDVFPPGRADRSIWQTGVRQLASIPLDPAVARAGDLGAPILLAEPDGVQARVYHGLATQIVEWSLERGT